MSGSAALATVALRPGTSPSARVDAPLVVGIGGTLRVGSSSEVALRIALGAASAAGARTQAFVGEEIEFPIYAPERPGCAPKVKSFLDAVRSADGIIIASPGYHGSVSGLIKNALDYLEDLRGDARPYLDGRAVGSIVCAHGWQATVTTLSALRDIVHALRGWPTPYGATINSSELGTAGCEDDRIQGQLTLVGSQVAEFARSEGYRTARFPTSCSRIDGAA